MEFFPQLDIGLTFVFKCNMVNLCHSHESINIWDLICWNYMNPWMHWKHWKRFVLFILTIQIWSVGPISSEQWCECDQPWPGVRSEEILQHIQQYGWRHGTPPSPTSNTHSQGSTKLEKSLFLPNILFILSTEIFLIILRRWNMTFKNGIAIGK